MITEENPARGEAIRSTFNDPLDSVRLSERADDFSTEVVADEYMRFLEELVRSSSE